MIVRHTKFSDSVIIIRNANSNIPTLKDIENEHTIIDFTYNV